CFGDQSTAAQNAAITRLGYSRSSPRLLENLLAQILCRILLPGIAGLKFQPSLQSAGPANSLLILFVSKIESCLVRLHQFHVGKIGHGLWPPAEQRQRQWQT